MRSQLALSFLALVNMVAIGLASFGSAPRALPWVLLLLQIALATKLMSRTWSSPTRSSAEQHSSSSAGAAGVPTERDHSATRARGVVAILMISTVATGLLLWLVMVVGWAERIDRPALWGDHASGVSNVNRGLLER